MEFSFDPATRSTAEWRPDLVGDVFVTRGLCGRSMNGGLLRFHDAASAPAAQECVDAMFDTRGLAAEVFAFDWLARQFAVLGPQRTIVVLDPFDGTVTPWVELALFEAALSTPLAQVLLPDLFREWMLAKGIDRLEFDWCAGATVPGFYGGKRDVGNLTLDPAEVYLHFTRQLWEYGHEHGPGSPPPHLRMAKER